MTHPLNDFEQRIGYRFSDPSLLTLALTHKSCESAEGHNERLEFLGDAVLDLIIAETLYHEYSDRDEGTLDHMRASLVNGKALAELACTLGIETFLQVSEAQRQHHPEHSAAMLEDALEALVGAVYLDGGIAAARSFVLQVFEEAIHVISETCDSGNPKGRLQEWLQKQYAGATPEYSILSEEGPDHARMFMAVVAFEGKEIGRGRGNSKKAAEIAAAEQALTLFNH
jgi:ribonuclease-3